MIHMAHGVMTFCGEELYAFVDGELDRDNPLLTTALDHRDVECQDCLDELHRSNAAWATRRARYGATVPTHISFEVPLSPFKG